MEITHGNLFSGSGTWELAAQICGIKTLWEAEIEPFPVAVEAKKFPDAIQLGDVSKISGADIPAVDIMTNSSPCQDLSVAGKRAGLDGERSGLFDQAIRICKEMRDAQRRLHNGWTDDDLRLLRLQGFPPDWAADIPHTDSQEYKMWGNGIALPCLLPMMKAMADELDFSKHMNPPE